MKERGLTTEEVKILQEKYGKNELITEKKEKFIFKILHIISEPMFLLLLAAAFVYFVLGEAKDGIIMLVFVVGIISIDIIQEWKTDKTIQALKDLSEPKIAVLRDGKKTEINSSELVPGDIMYIYEGIKIPADGHVINCNGLKVDESSLTGESVGVWKTSKKYNNKNYFREDYCYQGTLVIQGTGTIKVDKIGNETEYGKIGLNISKTEENKTLLQKQTDKLVKYCAVLALCLMIFVSIITFINLSNSSFQSRIIDSVLAGITLAMAMIPEEFPVILTVFLSMGAWRLAKKKSLIKKLPSVETLGAVSVLCVDKTGTITKNNMEITEIYDYKNNKNDLIEKMCLCCEKETYDPMEKAMFKYASKLGMHKKDIFKYKQVKVFPFSNETKMMGVAYEIDKKVLMIAKGSPESILKTCDLNEKEKKNINKEIKKMQEKGLRVIAVASNYCKKTNILDDNLINYKLEFIGLVGLIDPPRDSIYNDIKLCKKAGVKIVMITGDNGITASAIAKNIGMDNTDHIITGEMIDKMTFEELKEKVKDVTIFSRVIPEHKMQIVRAFQSNGEIVAMTGDGVNDAPALKQADIGIAMGQRGSEVSREAADLILLDDNFNTIVETIKDGRRIYDNIKKAVGYIFVIYIPIALSSLMCPLLGVSPNNLMFLPIHIVLLELLIDPTCSIVLERQPSENNIMNRPPRKVKENIADIRTIIKSMIQGLVIFISSFGTYCYALNVIQDILLARTMSLLIIMISNIFLVQVNSSNEDFVITSISKLIKDKIMVLINLLMIIAIVIITYSPLNKFLKLKALSLKELFIVIIIAFISVFWYEIIKLIKKLRKIN